MKVGHIFTRKGMHKESTFRPFYVNLFFHDMYEGMMHFISFHLKLFIHENNPSANKIQNLRTVLMLASKYIPKKPKIPISYAAVVPGSCVLK